MRTLALILVIFFSTNLAAEVYRSVDENGNVVFTDKPGPDSELIEIDDLQTIKPPPSRGSGYKPPKKAEAPYSAINILSPANDEAIRSDAGNVTINIEVKPTLRPRDNVVLYMDGKEIELGKAMAKAFSGLDRGTHQIRAAVKDPDGRIQHSSTSVSFHLLRNTVRN